MSLPYPSMVFVPLDVLTAEEMNQLVANIESLSAGTTYSTTETVIGTWINGKPLYRKVIDTLTGTGGNNTFNLTTVLDANIDRCYHLDAVIWSSTSTGLIPPYNTSSQDYFRAFVGGSNVLSISLGSVYTSTVQFRCVFYYTKTTD